MAIGYTDFLQTVVGGAIAPWTAVFVRLVSNNTGTAYVSDAATDVKGKFTFTTKPPGDSYTVYTGPSGTGPWTLTGDASYAVPIVAGETPAFSSVTTLSNSPYVPSAPVGTIIGAGAIYDVKAWGAKGDNSADDTAAIVAAYTACNAAGGGVVYFPPGTYLIKTGPIYITTAVNVTFRGSGWGSSLQIPNTVSGTQYIFSTGTATISNLLIEDLDLNIPYTGGTWAQFQIGAGVANGVRFNRVQFRGVNYTGAIPYFMNCSPTAAGGFTDWHVTKCRFYNPGTVQINGMVIRGFTGLEVDGNQWVNVNNPIIPDNLYQKYDLRFTNNEEIYTVTTINMEGFDVMGCQGVVCINNQQWTTVAQAGTVDLGGVLIDTHAGLVTDGIVIQGNTFYGNPIATAPQNGAPVTNCLITGNTIWATRSTAGVNSGIVMGTPDGGTSKNIMIFGNSIDGTFTGAPINFGTGYTSQAVSCHNNAGANPNTIQSPTEAVLVSGVTLGLGTMIKVTLTAARLVGAILNPVVDTRVTFMLTQGGAGGFAVTWNAVFKKTWADTGNTTGKISSISFIYDGTNWVQDGAQAPYV